MSFYIFFSVHQEYANAEHLANFLRAALLFTFQRRTWRLNHAKFKLQISSRFQWVKQPQALNLVYELFAQGKLQWLGNFRVNICLTFKELFIYSLTKVHHLIIIV